MTYKKRKRLFKVERAYSRMIGFVARFRKTFITLIILLFGLPIFYLPSKVEGWDFYNETIGNEYYQEEIRPHIDKWLGGSLRMFVRDVFEKSSYRDPEKTVLHVNAEMDYGHTLEQMDYIISKVEEYLNTVEGVEKFVTQVQSGQHANISIYFDEEYEESSLPYQLKNRLISRSLDWGGVEWDIYGVGKGFSNSTGTDIPRFRVEMRGYNYDELGNQASILADKLLSHKRVQKVNTNERLSYWEKSTEEFVLRLDYEKSEMAGADVPSLLNEMKTRARPTEEDLYISLNHDMSPLVIKEKQSESFSKYDLMIDPVFSGAANTQKAARIENIGTLQFETTTNSIHKEDRLYIRHVSFDYFGSHHFGNKFLDEKLLEMENEMPLGYSVKKRSFNWNFDKTKRQYSLLLILVAAIFFICAILFENLKQPLIIIATIPVSFIGLFLIFSVFGFYFDQGGYAAFLLLGGLVVNASIFVLSDFKNLTKVRKHNKKLVKATTGKASPIMLTLLSTIFGLAPFLIEGQDEVFWFSLAIGTIGGLLFSVFALFVFLPVLMWCKKR